MRKILAAIIISIFLPFLAFAAESSPLPSVLPAYNIFDSLRSVSAKIESYITPENAKEKGFWAWSQETVSEFLNRSFHTASNIGEFIKNKGQLTLDSIANKTKEKIGENIWLSGEQFIKNSIDFINKKIQN